MKYLVKISVVDNGSVSVEADSVEEAKEKAEEAYYNGQVFWNQSEITNLDVNEEKTRPHERCNSKIVMRGEHVGKR
jgi:hypothetical protein